MKLSRRAFLQTSVGALAGAVGWVPAIAQDRFDQDALLAFEPVGAITLVHIGDLHGQMMPHYSRPAEVNIAAAERADKVPHLSGEAFRIEYGVGGGTPMDYAFTHENFADLAMAYGPIGGLDRVATTLRAIRATRPETLFLTGMQNGQGTEPDAPPLGQHAAEILLTLNPTVTDRHVTLLERGGTKIGVVRTPSADAHVPWQIEDARAQGAEVVICLSQNGLAGDLALARSTPGIDVILSSASPAALPAPIAIGTTHIIASGTQTRFVARIDIDVQEGAVVELNHKLIPMFSDLIMPDAQVAARIQSARAPYAGDLGQVVGRAKTLLFTRGSVTSTWDDVICAALMAQFDAQIALSPGFGWGNSILAGQNITREDIYSLCGTADVYSYLTEMTGAKIKEMLELEAAQSFHAAPRPHAPRDMIRVGGLKYGLNVNAEPGKRISNMMLIKDQTPIEPDRIYPVAGWGTKQAGTKGPPIWEILAQFIGIMGEVGGQSISEVALLAAK